MNDSSIVELVLNQLVQSSDPKLGRWTFQKEGAATVSAALAELKDRAELKAAVEELLIFALYASEKLASPEVSARMIEILGSTPEIERLASEAEREKGMARLTEMRGLFDKRLAPSSGSDAVQSGSATVEELWGGPKKKA